MMVNYGACVVILFETWAKEDLHLGIKFYFLLVPIDIPRLEHKLCKSSTRGEFNKRYLQAKCDILMSTNNPKLPLPLKIHRFLVLVDIWSL